MAPDADACVCPLDLSCKSKPRTPAIAGCLRSLTYLKHACLRADLMYKKVLYSEVEYPADMPGPTRDLIAGLLRRDPATRLGSGPDGVEAVKREPYFAELDFARLVEKQIEPPWRPQVESEIDHSNFSSDFTDLAAVDSLAEESVLTDSMQRQFTNFTYTQGGALIAE